MYRIASFNVCPIGVFAFSKVFFFVLIYEIVYRKSWDLGYGIFKLLGGHAPRQPRLPASDFSNPCVLHKTAHYAPYFRPNLGGREEGHFSSILWRGTAWLAKGVAYKLKRLGVEGVQNAPWSVYLCSLSVYLLHILNFPDWSWTIKCSVTSIQMLNTAGL